jgi:transposase
MAYNFLPSGRDQAFLLPPDLRDWLPTDHLAWFVLDMVDQLDLGPFLRAYRADGHGRAAYDPKTLLGVLLYAYATGVRSSRQIQRRCVEDLAFRVLAANQTPDHVTIARFRARHEAALAGFLVASLKLCAAAERQQRYAQRVAAATAAARAKGKPPRQLKPRPRDEAPNPKATANVTDPDSRFLHTRKGSVQGYNAQAVTTCHQLVVAAELTQDANDLQQLDPHAPGHGRHAGRRGYRRTPRHVAGGLRLLVDRQPDRDRRCAGVADPAGQARPAGQVPQGRQAVGVQERPAPRGDDRQAQQRGRQGPLRQTQGDCRGGLRAEQGCPWCSPADAPRDGRVRRGVEAVVRHP